MARRSDSSTENDRIARRLERGTEDHYLDPELYDHEYRRRRADVNWYRREVLASSLAGAADATTAAARAALRDVLELGCGSGRVLVPLVRDGFRVVGVDRSQPMLLRCADRVARLSTSARERARLVRADFRNLPFSRRWQTIICPFNAMMHLYTREDLLGFLSSVRDRLAPSGRFLFDVMNPDLEWLTRDPLRRWAKTRFKDPRTGETWIYSTNHLYDDDKQIAWVRLYYDEASPPRGRHPRARVVELAQRQLFPEELLLMLEVAGFKIVSRVGDFDGSEFRAGSPSQLCTCSMRP